METYHTILRAAVLEDAEIVFQWRNDPTTRQVSFHSEEILWETHQNWFQQSLANPNRRIYIGEVMPQKVPFGQVRFDITSPHEAEISIVIAPEWRGKGMGGMIIREGIALFRTEHPEIYIIIAFIKPDNIPSKKLFQNCGFEYQENISNSKECNGEKWILKIERK
jgi:RimJ/RimL family protein N-acetyltransferase